MPRYTGSAGNDTIKGGNAGDTITGGAGNDVITGDLTFQPLTSNFNAGLGVWTISGSGGTYDPPYNGLGNRVLWLDDDGISNSASTNVVGPSWSSDLRFSITLDATTQSEFGGTPGGTFSGGDYFRIQIVVDGTPVASATQITGQSTNLFRTYSLDLTPTGQVPANPNAPMQLRIIELKPSGSTVTNNLNFDNVTLTVTDPNAAGTMNDSIDGGEGNDTIDGMAGDDRILGGSGNDNIRGGAGRDTIDGGTGSDVLAGGQGNDVFVWDGASNDTISDFRLGNSGPVDDGDSSNNDFVDLSGIFNAASLAAYNLANETEFTTPLQALNHDAADGVISFNGTDMTGPTLTLSGVSGWLSTDETAVVCFARGTLIMTADGFTPIEKLGVGDRVETLDEGLKPIVWISSSVFNAIQIAANPALRPIRIRKGSLGENMPARDLTLSQQHRVLVRSRIAQRLFGCNEILIPAKKLIDLEGFDFVEDAAGVEYFHILLENHEILNSNGAYSESLFFGEETRKTMTQETIDQINTLIHKGVVCGSSTTMARGTAARARTLEPLLARHQKNRKPLFAGNPKPPR